MPDLWEAAKSVPSVLWGALISSLVAPVMWLLGRQQRAATEAKDLAAAEASRADTEKTQAETNRGLWDDVSKLQGQLAAMRTMHDAEMAAATKLHDAQIVALNLLHAAEMDALRKIIAELERQAKAWQAERADILQRLARCEQKTVEVATT